MLLLFQFSYHFLGQHYHSNHLSLCKNFPYSLSYSLTPTSRLTNRVRLAVAEELTPDAPLILDDALVRFDDDRLATALDILSREAENKQVILFTCQTREKNAIQSL